MIISVRRSHKLISQNNYLCSVVHILLVINFFRPVYLYFFYLRFNIAATDTLTHADMREARI